MPTKLALALLGFTVGLTFAVTNTAFAESTKSGLSRPIPLSPANAARAALVLQDVIAAQDGELKILDQADRDFANFKMGRLFQACQNGLKSACDSVSDVESKAVTRVQASIVKNYADMDASEKATIKTFNGTMTQAEVDELVVFQKALDKRTEKILTNHQQVDLDVMSIGFPALLSVSDRSAQARILVGLDLGRFADYRAIASELRTTLGTELAAVKTIASKKTN